MYKLLIVSALLVSLTGCVITSINGSIREYNEHQGLVELGDSKSVVINKLKRASERLPEKLYRNPDKYKANGKYYEIIYYRSSWTSDGLNTDDEYTPYLFENNELIAIGWQTLGGPKSTAAKRR